MTAASLGTRLRREADAHDYFAANPDLRMTTGDHANRAKNLRAIIAELESTPTPPADAVRALVGKWAQLETFWSQAGTAYGDASATTYSDCADELEAALSAAPAGEEPEFDFHDTGDDYCRQCGCAYTYAAAPTPEAPLPTADKVRRVIDIARGMGNWDGKTFNPELAAAIRDLTQQEGGRHG